MPDNIVTIPFSHTEHRIIPPIQSSDKPYPARLTTKEVLLLQMLADGLAPKEIAAQVGTTVQTVKNSCRTVRDKTGMDTTLAAVVWAIRHKVID